MAAPRQCDRTGCENDLDIVHVPLLDFKGSLCSRCHQEYVFLDHPFDVLAMRRPPTPARSQPRPMHTVFACGCTYDEQIRHVLRKCTDDPRRSPVGQGGRVPCVFGKWTRDETAVGRLSAVSPAPRPIAEGRGGPCPRCGSFNILDASQSLDCRSCGHSW